MSLVASPRRCPTCGGALTEPGPVCPSCGPVSLSPPTATAGTEVRPATGPSAPRGSDAGRYRPGDVLARRYRIVERVGKGGMGEVYHADDLTLNQPVALKLLPDRLARDSERLDGLKKEVRISRQVSHPNVCRVYDITEADGLCFLSMEYIRGEDLRSLLQRIGRLPADKAAQVARQLASGLAAAHEKGILHRDLKPANVMLDERGHARIMDFGLAALAGTVGAAEITSGTPAYMAPEQRAGREVTERSDLYSLGLVLYEIFTGRPAFPRGDPSEPPPPPSSLVPGLDPAVDRVILRCLEQDPGRRPPSALDVRTAFPGSGLLTLAAARGETLPPELVAEAGDFAALSPGVAWLCLTGVALALAGAVWVAGRTRLTSLVPLPKSPEVLAAEARGILDALGYPSSQRDRTRGFSRDSGYIDHLMAAPRRPDWWTLLARGEPSVIRFWYRESPTYLVPHRTTEFFASEADPPLSVPGMVTLELDTRGRLRRLEAVPSERDLPGGQASEPDWTVLFAQAKLDPASFAAVEPRWRPPAFADRRAAWDGRYPDAPEIPIRVEAASLDGRPVAFRVLEPWTRDAAAGRPGWVRSWDVVSENWMRLAHIGFHFSLLLGLGLLARRNLRSGRGDRRFAFRLASFLFAVVMLQWLLAAHHVPERSEFELLFGGLYRAFFAAGLGWLFYIVLEPYARRLWPRTLISWVRLLGGHWRDPQLGRDVLVGCLWGAAYAVLLPAARIAPLWRGGVPSRPDLPPHPATLLALGGVREAVAEMLAVVVNLTTHILFLFVALLLLRFLLRRTWLAIAAHWLGYVLVYSASFGSLPIVTWITLWHLFFFRLGLVAVLTATVTTDLLGSFPLTSDFSAWHAYVTFLAAGACLALAGYGFRVSLGTRPAFRDLLPER
jgi:eukaryotic-like serine/threonine-protein kinase